MSYEELNIELPEMEVGNTQMTQAEGVAYAEQIRARAHQIIDQKIDAFIQRLMSGGEGRQNIRPLGTNHKDLKGSRPLTVYISGREPVKVKTWQQVAHEILKDCNADAERHDTMMYLRDRVHGRTRTFISATPAGMGKPIKVDDELYVEGNFDTEALLRMLTKDIFSFVEYQWQGILVELRDQTMDVTERSDGAFPAQTSEEEGQNEQGEEPAFTGMSM